MQVHCQTHGQQWKIRTSLIISDLMLFTPHTILYLSPCVVENPTVSQVIMISGIHRMQLGSLDSGMRKRRSSCMSPVLHPKIRLTGSQSPTLNARPIVRAIKQTCRRGVEVILFLDLGTSPHPKGARRKADKQGFNDKGESIPFQGGTNEEVVDRLYKKLSKEKKEQYLKVYW